jgi:hypothetical protein
MEIKRTYETKDHEPTEYGTWDTYKTRYRLSLNVVDSETLHFEYEKFKVGFGSWENIDEVASDYSTSSYLWNDSLHPTWEEMALKEHELKEEFIRYFTDKVNENLEEISWRERRNVEYNDIIQGVKANYLKKHTMNGLEPQR